MEHLHFVTYLHCMLGYILSGESNAYKREKKTEARLNFCHWKNDF